MIEVLVSMVILLLGILGLAGLMVTSQRAETESYQRSQALLLLQDMVGRINANRKVAACYITTDSTTSAPTFLGVGSTFTPNCALGTIQADTQANNDMAAWGNLLAGASEQLGGSNAGAMVGARGCISGNPTTGIYQVSVAWQGIVSTTAAPAGLTCGTGQYGADDSLRRVVSVPLQIANLN